MPRKKSVKPASNAPTSPQLSPTLSDTTKCGAQPAAFMPSHVMTVFLASMDQNHRLTSKYMSEELLHILPNGSDCITTTNDLHHMGFNVECSLWPSPGPSKAAEPITIDNDEDNNLSYASKYEEEPLNFASVDQFLQRMIDWTSTPSNEDVENPSSQALLEGIIRKIYKLSKDYDIFDRVHKCPQLQPCTHQHQDDALPCPHLHAKDIPNPPPCPLPHQTDEDTPMEPAAPPRVLNEAATQTLTPSHEASRPFPPPAAVASLPAAAASIPPTSPHG
ncbi:hypothetical protein P691DRAFT_768364 [Macrolepiota fuliginosa MF-IS2]|uniref:Uncharacterized protein n=1 Tax=Macrolepiota fuliginosa MF-IS2 TaxID=1400762 RepID=A0A9P5WWG4_9AGAR|nr:hypothetical protein P691DRAFT_768364 [Macrolepiota fuliginosa MF-IS2]